MVNVVDIYSPESSRTAVSQPSHIRLHCEAMSDNSLPPRPKQREAERPLNTCTLVKYTEESELMILGEAIGYFNSNLPKEFRVTESVYSFKLKGREGETLSKGERLVND